jgi:xanthine dehydrogenase YagR molybdenum-binding subunit
MILRSKWPAAKVTKIDLSKAQAMPGVKAAVLAGGEQRTVRFYGQELAAVAATTKQQCLDALRAIEVEAQPLPFVVKEDDAMQPDSPNVFDPRLVQHQPAEREGRGGGRCRDGFRGRFVVEANCARRCSCIIRSRRTAAPSRCRATR